MNADKRRYPTLGLALASLPIAFEWSDLNARPYVLPRLELRCTEPGCDMPLVSAQERYNLVCCDCHGIEYLRSSAFICGSNSSGGPA
jgi:hypothetical protein